MEKSTESTKCKCNKEIRAGQDGMDFCSCDLEKDHKGSCWSEAFRR